MSRAALCTLTMVIVSNFTLFPTSWAREPDKGKPPADEVPKDLVPRLFTMEGKDLPLAKVLTALAEQTGNAVADRRASREEGAKVSLKLKNVTFWQALDAIAKAIDARVSMSDREAKIALVDGPFLALPVSYDGLFRVTVTRIDLTHQIDADNRFGIIYLEIAWEPRFQPLMMKTKVDSLDIQDDKGRSVDVPDSGEGTAPVGKRQAATLQVRINAPLRSAGQLKVFKGKISAIGPSKMLTFTFDKLAKIDPARSKTELTEVQDGVVLHLRELMPEGQSGDQVWKIGLLLEYPADGPKFESFQSWLVNNDIFLQKEKDGIRQKFPPNLGYETDDSTENKAIIRYSFGDEPEKNLLLGKFSDWKLIYKTPGKISELTIPFEFKDVPLP
jgi:hypothetical protein